jgi:hypothetical protein
MLHQYWVLYHRVDVGVEKVAVDVVVVAVVVAEIDVDRLG